MISLAYELDYAGYSVEQYATYSVRQQPLVDHVQTAAEGLSFQTVMDIVRYRRSQ